MSRFPILLESKATILGSITRMDLVVLGGAYLILSWMKVSGLISLLINIMVFLTLKFIQRFLPRGYFKGLNSKRVHAWQYELGKLNE